MTALVWSAAAVQDREDIYRHIEADNPIAAIELDELFDAQVDQLLAHPQFGRLGRVSGTREWVVQPNYILVYALAGEQLQVIRVLHAARRWP